MRKIFPMLLALLCIIANLHINNVHALYTYSVKAVNEDGTYTTLLETTSLSEARKYYANVDTSSNYALFQDDTVVSTIYGIVEFKRTNACDYNVEYRNASTNGSGYTNGCYGNDGLFLATNSEYTEFKFFQSNAMGWGKRKDLTVHPIETVQNVSNYRVENGRLYHQIKTNIHSAAYGASIDLGEAPSPLENDHIYYSYDGKYFYENFYDMRNDVVNGSHSLAVNNTPYYNYYQYVSNRTITSYTNEELKDFLENYALINSRLTSYLDTNNDSISEILTESQYYGNTDAFLQYQYEYGANALLMLAISMNETASGRSSLSYTRNNMFGHNAYDNSVEANASRYRSVASSIAYHAKVLISNNYSNPNKFQYHGSFLGDKGSGMNVSYASDPYWGEKAAQYYMRIDEAMGKKDYNSYALGIKSTSASIPVYSLPSIYSTPLYYTGNAWDYSFVLLDHLTIDGVDFYKVQIDPALDESRNANQVYYYDFKKAVGYVRASDLNYIVNEGAIHENEYVTETYYGLEGVFLNGENEITITYRSNDNFEIEKPVLEGYIFDCWQDNNDNSFTALYKYVESAWVSGDYQLTYNPNQTINLKDMTLNLLFTDGSKTTLPVNSDMISKTKLTDIGPNELTVAYQGAKTNITLYVEEKDTSIQEALYETLTTFITTHETLGDDASILIDLLSDISYYNIKLSYDEIRQIDLLLKDYYDDLEIIINDERLDLSLSGLGIVLNPLKFEGSALPKNLYINVNPCSEELTNTFKQITLGNSWHYYDSFTLQMLLAKEEINLNENFVVSIKTMDDNPSKYYIVMAEKDGVIYRLYGTQSDSRIVFNTQGYSNFAIAYLNTTNNYGKDDVREVYNISDNGFDVRKRMIITLSIFISLTALLFITLAIYLFKPRVKKPRKYEDIKQVAPITVNEPTTEEIATKEIKLNSNNDNSYDKTKAYLSDSVKSIMNDEALKKLNEEYRERQRNEDQDNF